MAKSATNLNQDSETKQICFQLFGEPNAETAAMNEYFAIKQHPERYKRYSSFKDAMNEVFYDEDDE